MGFKRFYSRRNFSKIGFFIFYYINMCLFFANPLLTKNFCGDSCVAEMQTVNFCKNLKKTTFFKIF